MRNRKFSGVYENEVNQKAFEAATLEEINYFEHFLFIPFNLPWEITVSTAITVSCIFTLYLSFFSSQIFLFYGLKYVFFSYSFLTLVYFLSDFIFFADLCILIIHRLLHRIRVTRPYPPVGKMYLFIALISIIPSLLNVKVFLYRDPDLIWSYVRLLILLRIMRTVKIYSYLMNSVYVGKLVLMGYFCSLFGIVTTVFAVMFVTLLWKKFALFFHASPEKSIPLFLPMLNVTKFEAWHMKTQQDVFLFGIYLSTTFLLGRGQLSYTPTVIFLVCFYQIIIVALFISRIILLAGFAAIDIHEDMNNVVFHARKESLRKKLAAMDVSKEICSLVMKWYDLLWEKRRGITDTSIAETVPFGLYHDCCLDIFYPALLHSHIFKDMNKTFLAALSMRMKTKFHCPGDVLYKKGMLRDTMYYVHVGIVHVMSMFDDSTPIVSLFPGSCFGESTLILSYPCSIKITCATYCELKILPKTEFLKVVRLFPDEFKKMQVSIQRRYQKAEILYAMKMIIKRSSINDLLGLHDEGALKRIKRISREIDRTMFCKSTGKFDQEDRIHKIMSSEKIRTEYIGTTSDYLHMVVISHITNENNTETFIRTSCPVIFHPISPFIKVWNFLTLVCVIIMTFMIPYEAGLGHKMSQIEYATSILIQIIFILDLIIQCTFAIMTKDKTYKTMQDIFFYRLGTLEYKADVLGSVPMNFVVSFYESMSVNAWGLLKLNYVLRAWRIVKIFDNSITKSYSYRKSILLFSYTCYFIYFMCYWSMIFSVLSCFNYKCNEKSMWMMTEGTDISQTHPLNVILKMTLKVVLLCLGIGGGQVQPFTLNEHLATMAMSMTFLFLDAYIIAGMIANEVHMLSSQALVKQTITSILNFADKHQLPQNLQYRINRHLKIVQMTRKDPAMFSGSFELTGLSDDLRKELKLSAWVNSVLKVPLFIDTERKFIYEMTDHCQSIIFPSNEVVIYSGIFPEFCYIIQKGYVQILSESGEVEGNKSTGWSFAVLELVLDIPIIKTIRTLTSCEFLRIKKADFFSVLDKFPQYKNQIHHTTTQCSQLFDLPVVEGANYNYLNKDISENSFYSFGYTFAAGSKAEKEFLKPFMRVFGHFTLLRFLLARIVILPTGNAIWIYEIVRSCLALCSCLTFPAKIIFISYSSYFAFLFIFLDITAYIDLYIRLHVGYYNDKGLLIMHPLLTAINYLKNGFTLDLIGCFPFEILFSKLATIAYAPYWMTYNRVVQVHRIIGFLTFTYTSKVYCKPYILTFQYFIIVIVVINLLASVTFLNSCEVEKDINLIFDKYQTTGVFCSSLVYNPVQFGRELTPVKVYILFQYFISTLVAQVNISGIGSWGTTGGFKLIASVFGYFITVYLTGRISGTIFYDNITLSFQHNVKRFIRFLDKQNIDKSLKEEFIQFYEVLWEKHNGIDPKGCLKTLNMCLESDIIYHVYGKYLKEYTIFARTTTSFFWSMLLLFDPKVFHKGSVIITEGFVQNSIFILNEGFISVLSGKRQILRLKKGSFFGNLFSTQLTQQTTSFIADTSVEVLEVHPEKFFNILNAYPHYRELYNRNLHRFQQHGIWAIPSTVEDQEDDDEESTNKNIMMQKYTFTSKKYDYLKTSTYYFSSIFALYMISFKEFTLGMVLITYGLDIMTIIIIIISCYRPYKNAIGEYETNLNKIRLHYRQQRFGFWFDLFSVIPFELLMFLFDDRARAFVNLHFNRIIKYVIFCTFLKGKFQKISNRKYTMVICNIVLHFYNLIFFLAATLTMIYACSDEKAIPAFASARYRQLILSITIILANFAHCPYQSTLPYFYSETIIYRSIEMVIVIICSAVIIGYFLYIIESYFNDTLSYLKIKRNILNSIQLQRLGKFLYKCTESYLKILWDLNSGSQRPQILSAAPKTLQLKLLKALYQHHINNHYIFSNCQQLFIDQVLLFFTEELILPGNIIVRMGTKDNTMYFIHRGEVREYIKNELGKEVLSFVLLENDTFGTKQGLYVGIPHTRTYRAHTTTIVLKLNFKSWSYLFKFFPVEQRRIYEILKQYSY